MNKITLLLGIITLLTNMSFAQEDKTVTLTVNGQGKTQDEAKQNALRSAIEQAFGTFISSNTEILNGELVKDEISSVSSGNIQKFDVVSEVEIPDGGYATTLKATVSVTNLTSFVESKGVVVEFKGSLFGANVKQQRMNEEAEWKSIINLCEVSNRILSKSLDYSIEIGEPVKAQETNHFKPEKNDYQIMLTIKASPNINFDKFLNYFYSSIKSISMPVSEQDDYKKLKKKIYTLKVKRETDTKFKRKLTKEDKFFMGITSDKKIKPTSTEKLFFRNRKTSIALQNLFLKSNQYLHNFKVRSNVDTITVKTGGSHNIYNHRDGYPKIWHLNSANKTYSSRGSKNSHPGFPHFYFVYDDPNWLGEDQTSISSWRTYFAYVKQFSNSDILFESNPNFTATGRYYEENGVSSRMYRRLNSPYDRFPNIHEIIGTIKLVKIDYYSKYLAIYSEEEISKITNVLVEKLK